MIPRSQLPKTRHLIGMKWVFMTKVDKRLRARLVVLGYRQVLGLDYVDNHAPVVADATLRIILLVKMTRNLKLATVDIETAFLESDLEEEIYIKLPRGLDKILDVPEGHIGRINKAVYGLVQAARQFYLKMTEFLTSIGFQRSLVDPCLFKSDKVYILLYVDDFLLCGKQEDLESVIKLITNKFSTRVSFEVNKFIGVELLWGNNQKKLIMHQGYIIKRILEDFSAEIFDKKIPLTPAPAMSKIKLHTEDEDVLSPELQKSYMTGVGSLLYLVKYSRPDIANVTRELSKTMLRANEADYKQLLRVIKFVTSTSTLGIEYLPQVEAIKWQFISYVDSDWAGNTDDRRSVSGWCIFVNNCLIGWGSRAQKNVTLASTEAEYVGLSEVSKEILFIKKVLEFFGVQINFPIIIFVDNMGAIYLAEGKGSKRTKHIDMRYHYVREYVEDGILKIIFVRSQENMADPFTKNVSQAIFDKQFTPYMKNLPENG